MNRKIVIDPEYHHLEEYIRMIPDSFDELGKVIHKDRNILRHDKHAGVVIKSYKRIYLPNRIRYTYFYPSKAQRAFDFGKHLLANGFLTPKPIAYVECTTNLLLTSSYFVSEFTDFKPLKMVRELPPEEQTELLEDFSAFTYRLHLNHIYHRDYSVGNILFKKIDGRYEFSLVDNNLMDFGPVDFRRGIRTMGRLGLPVDQLVAIGKMYGRLWNVDEIDVMERLFHYQKNMRNAHKLKRSGKQILRKLSPV